MQPTTPTILVILGVTGDLMSLKITPALFHLFTKNKLPAFFRVVGFARREWTDEFFHKTLEESLVHHIKKRPKKSEIKKFLSFFSYHKGDFARTDDYQSLNDRIAHIDEQWGMCSNKLFYIAASPFNYEIILKQLATTKVARGCAEDGGWTRVIVEKPFGTNKETALKLDRLLGRLFKESQIYRIDHYLGKEMLQNILAFRFSNNLFEQNWDSKTIEKIRVLALEKLDAGARGGFYDKIGALRDYGQNHLLQMLSLVTMEHPVTYLADAIRDKKSRVLQTLKPLSKKDIAEHTFRAQYKGYRATPGVSADSQTETYFRLRLFIDSPRWRSVPLFLESGKALGYARKEIMVTFRHPVPCLCPPSVIDHYKNRLIFRLEPKEEILITFWAKKRGAEFEMEEQVLHFQPANTSGEGGLEAHEKLLLDCIIGDQTLFVSTQEIVSMWKFIDPIIRSWHNNRTPLHSYSPGSDDIRKESKYIEL